MDTDGFWYKFRLFYVDENVAWALILSPPPHPTTQPNTVPPPPLLLSSPIRQNKICHDRL